MEFWRETRNRWNLCVAAMDFSSLDVRTLTLLGAGLCTMASMHFTSQLVGQHMFYWKNPAQQKLIIIIVCMAPIYAVTSFFGLAEIKGSEILFTFLESIKECYEALVRGSSLFILLFWCVFVIFLHVNVMLEIILLHRRSIIIVIDSKTISRWNAKESASGSSA